MRIFAIISVLFIVQVDLRRHNDSQEHDNVEDLSNLLDKFDQPKTHSNKEYIENSVDDDQASYVREKKYPSRKKVLDESANEEEQPEKPRHSHSSKSNNRSAESNRRVPASTPASNYADEASLCINEYDVKSEKLVKVNELKNGARMIRFIRIEEPSSSHGLDVRDICMLNCCVEKDCDLAMLSEQRTKEGYKCYLFACNESCTYANHQDYTSMILKKDLTSGAEPASSANKPAKSDDKQSDASSSTLSTTCRSTEFSCRDGSCIPYYDVCNSYEDCPSGVDETMCSPEFLLHQRTQQENRKKPSPDAESDGNNEAEEVLDELLEEDSAASASTAKTPAKSTTMKSPSSSSSTKSKSKNREGSKASKNSSSAFVYNIDLDTQERVSKLQKLKEHLEETKGPEAWYHLFQTLIQHQQQDHSNVEPEAMGGSSSTDDENFKDHLLALEQQWIADRQKSTTATTTEMSSTTSRTKFSNRKSTTSATTRRTKTNNDGQRPTNTPPDEEATDDEDEEGTEDGDRYYWQPSYDDRRGNRYNSPRKQKTSSATTTLAAPRKSKTKYPSLNRDSTAATLLRANGIESDNSSHTRSFLRESSVILLLLVGLIFTIVLLVLVGFYCRDSCKRGRVFKNRSTDADYLINGLYL